MNPNPNPGHHFTFTGSSGAELAGRLDLPAGPTRAFALFAHCFTCSKDLRAAGVLARKLNEHGIGVLRFDFTGLGHSEGEFANTDFSSNVGDLELAAAWLRDNHAAPEILIGHSLGGAAVLAAGVAIPEVKSVVTVNAPSSVDHVSHLFSPDELARIATEGDARATIGGRTFTVGRQLIDDLMNHSITERAAELGRDGKALLVMHAPTDNVVGIGHAKDLYEAARHPKSFVALDGADHLLSRSSDAEFVGSIIATWALRYVLGSGESRFRFEAPEPTDQAVVAETGVGSFLNHVVVGNHRMLADEPAEVGGFDAGPAPYDFLAAGLGACTSMTLRLYAERKGMTLRQVRVEVGHAKAKNDEGRMVDRFHRRIHLDGDLSDDERMSLLSIADRCPVHRTLEAAAEIVTEAG